MDWSRILYSLGAGRNLRDRAWRRRRPRHAERRFRLESKAAQGQPTTGKSTPFRQLTLTAVNYNTSIGLESSFNKKG
jgi:hypothetical protein